MAGTCAEPGDPRARRCTTNRPTGDTDPTPLSYRFPCRTGSLCGSLSLCEGLG